MQTLLKNTEAIRLLKKEGEKSFSHAYLLVFDDSKHLKTALKEFAKILFSCDEPTTQKEHRIATLIDEESFSDCLFYPTEGKKLMVEDAENILEESTLAPVEGEKKIFVLSDFAEANAQTQNKLLKLLEEPPKGVTFLLGATSAFPILQTVLSRVKKLEIFPFDAREVTECLHRIYGDKYDSETLTLCAAASGGNVGDARNILEGGYYQALCDGAFELILAPSYKLPSIVKEMGETAHKREFLTLLRLIFRDALLVKSGQKRAHLLLPMQKEQTAKVAEKYSLGCLLYAQECLSEAEKQVKFNAIFSQCIELCMAKILNYKD